MQAKERFAVAKSKFEEVFRQSGQRLITEEFPMPVTSLPQLYTQPATEDHPPVRERNESLTELKSKRREEITPGINSPENPSFKRFMLSLSANVRDKYEDEVAKRIFDSHTKVNSD